MFIMEESDAEQSGARSIHATQKTAAPNMLNPAAAAISGNATEVSAVWVPMQRNAADSHMPTHPPSSRPRRFPNLAVKRSESHPPSGASNAMARKGVDIHV